MEHREAFTGISAELEESMDEISWRQKCYNQTSRGKRYFNRGNGRGYHKGSNYQPITASRGISYDCYINNSTKKTGTASNNDLHCLLCGLKGHKVATC